MHIALNKLPTVAYAKEPFLALIEDGYALPIQTQGDATVMLFKDVEDHIDGNGIAILWMLEGGGTFYCNGQDIALTKGDAIVFDDNLEHGFEADDYCLAVSFDTGLTSQPDLAFIHATLDAFNLAKPAPTEFSNTPASFWYNRKHGTPHARTMPQFAQGGSP